MSAGRSGSLSRSFLGTARSFSLRSSSPLPRLRRPLLAAPRPQSPRLSFHHPSRPVGALGCTQSLLPLHSVVAAARLTSYLSAESRSCCELSQGT